jgi:hypothetical protein
MKEILDEDLQLSNQHSKGSRRKNKEITKNVTFKEEIKKSKNKIEKPATTKKPQIQKQQPNDSLDDDDDEDDYGSNSDGSTYNMMSLKKEDSKDPKSSN